MPAFNSSPDVELIVGPYRSGKTSRLLESLVAHSRRNPLERSLVVVPSARYRSLLAKRLLSADGGHFGIDILPFYSACDLVLKKHQVSYRLLPDAVRVHLLASIINELQKENALTTLSPVASFSGTHAAILELLDEFQRSGLGPAAVEAKLQESASLSSRHMELALIYRRYWDTVQSLGYLDKRRLALRACQSLYGEDSPKLGISFLAVDGFDRFSRMQTELIAGLARHIGVGKVSFDYLPPEEDLPEEYSWKQSSYRELLDAFEPLSPVVTQCCLPSTGARPAVAIFAAQDRYAEMSEVTSRLKQKLIAESLAPEECLVVVRDFESYRGAVQRAFDDAGLKYAIDDATSLRELPIIKLIVRLLRLHERGYPRGEIMAALRSPYLRLKELGLSASEVDKLDDRSLQSQIVSGDRQWSHFFSQDSGRPFSGPLGKLFAMVAPPNAPGSLTSFSTWIEDLLDRLVTSPGSDEGPDAMDSRDVRHGLAGVRAALTALLEEENILGTELVAYHSFLQKLEHVLDGGNFRPQIGYTGAITICSANTAPNQQFKEIFIAGMVEGEFPSRHTQSGFISSEEISSWRAFGININNPREHPGFEWALFQSLTGRASQSVTLSFPRYDMSGEELVISFFIAQGNEQVINAIPFASLYDHPALSVRDACAGFLWRHQGMSPPAPAPSHLSKYSGLMEFWRGLEEPVAVAFSRAPGQSSSLYNGYLTDLVSSDLLSVDIPEAWSASSLNDYGKCPFRFWVSRILKVQPKVEPAPGLSVERRGVIYHRILELFYRRVEQQKITLGSENENRCFQVLEECTEQALAELEADMSFTAGEFWMYEKLDIHFRIKLFVKRELARWQVDTTSCLPFLEEVGFGSTADVFAPLNVTGEERPISIRGKIDRIDAHITAGEHPTEPPKPKYVRVIDYKTSSQNIPLEEAISGRNMQLPLYALAVERAVLPGSRVNRGLYLSIHAGEKTGEIDFDTDEGKSALKAVEEHVRAFSHRISQGDFSVLPNGSKVCGTCNHRKICRITELRTLEDIDEQPD